MIPKYKKNQIVEDKHQHLYLIHKVGKKCYTTISQANVTADVEFAKLEKRTFLAFDSKGGFVVNPKR